MNENNRIDKAVGHQLEAPGELEQSGDNTCGLLRTRTFPVKRTKIEFQEGSRSCKSHGFRWRRRLKLNNLHRTHKRFEYMSSSSSPLSKSMRILNSVLLVTLVVVMPIIINCLDSPVKVQRFKQQLSSSNAATTTAPKSAIEQQPPISNSSTASKIDRVRRLTNLPSTSHHHTPSNSTAGSLLVNSECPPTRLIHSLLPAEHQPSSSSSQRAYCDCVKDLYGWQVTCYAGSGNGSSRRQQQQLQLQQSESQSQTQHSNGNNALLPNQLHPAFRAPQLQRQQQQQAAAAAAASGAHRRVHRSPARWMGETNEPPSGNAPTDSLTDDSSSSHEGFGDEPTTVKPSSSASASTSAAGSRQQNWPTSKSSPANNETVPNSSISQPNQDDNFVLSPSSNSFTLLHPTQDNYSTQQQDTFNSSSARLMSSEKPLTQQSNNNNNNNNNNVLFHVVPILFSVKYSKNNMIEIDCDQMAPHYKPAMFQGFNVNEISSFTFNNCQLPNIPFSALLHRTKSSLAISNTNPQQVHTSGSGSGRLSSGQQALKPSRLRHQNLVRRRRQIGDNEHKDEMLLSAAAAAAADSLVDGTLLTDDHEPTSSTTALPASTQRSINQQARSSEPKVRSLTVNLNTVVDQRTLMSLLTGLDLLEELQLNYMQLNLTNFEPDLEADPSVTTPSSTPEAPVSSQTRASTSSPTLLAPSSPASVQVVAQSQSQQVVTPGATTSQQSLPVAPTTTTGSSSSTTTSTTTTTTSTTAAPVQILFAASSSTQTPALSLAAGRTLPSPPSTIVRNTQLSPAEQRFYSSTQAPTIAPTTTTSTSTTSTTTSTTTGRPSTQKPLKQQQQVQVQQAQTGARPMQVTATRPSLSTVGAPRGLMIAQATSNQQQQTTTTPATQIQTQANNNNNNNNNNNGQTTVPTVPLATVLNHHQQQQQQTTRQTPNPPTTVTVTRQTQPNGVHISVASSQTQSVSYTNPTSSGRGVQQPTGSNQIFNQPPTSSNFIQPTTTNQNQMVGSSSPPTTTSSAAAATTTTTTTTRIHHSPTGWFQAQPAANQNQPTMLTTPVNLPPTAARLTSTGGDSLSGFMSDQPTSSAPSTSAWSPPAASSSPHQSHQQHQPANLNPPANTPYNTATLHNTNGFGIRTSQSSGGPLPVSVIQQYNNNNPNTFRVTTNSNQQGGGNTQPMTGGGGPSFMVGMRGMNTNQFTQPVVTTIPTTTTSASQMKRHTQQQQQQQQPQTTQGNNQVTMTTTSSESGSTMQFMNNPNNRLQQQMNQNRRQQQQLFVAQQAPITTTTVATTNNAGSRLSSSAAAAAAPVATGGAEDLMSFVSGVEPMSPSMVSSSSSASSAFTDSTDFEPSTSGGGGGGGLLRNNNQGRFKRAVASLDPLEEFELSFGELLPNLRYLRLQSFIDLSKAAAPKDSSSATTQPKKVQSMNSNRRFRRQFQPEDMPQKDDGHMSDSESDAIAKLGLDSLLAEETNVHHNSVMAPPSFDEQHNFNNMMTTRSGLVAQTNRNSSGNDGDQDQAPATGRSLVSGDMNSDESMDHQQQQQQQQQFLRIKRFSQVLVRMFSKLGKLRHLHLDRNDIPYWPDNVLFDSRHSLNRLYLLSNNIRLLGRNSLANLTELETLDLSLNQLRQLNGDMFRDLSSLRNFRACCNLFRRLPSRLFGQIPAVKQATGSRAPEATNNNQQQVVLSARANKLERLDFSKNPHLSQLSADLFAPGPNQQPPTPITHLMLSNCALTDQLAGKSPKALFASLPDLVSITLRGNKLRDLLATNGLFAKNNKLQALNVSQNQLASLSANLFNTNASQLMELQLEHNHIAQIPDQFLFNLRKLRRLSVAHNRLTHLSAYLFINNEQIEFIDLSHNQLVTLNTQQSQMMPFGTGQKLRHLNLGHNNLTNFKSDIFDINWIFYTHLQVLDLSSNKFEGQISMPIFHTITDEMLLNLASNYIQSVSVDDLKQHDEHPLDRYATNSAESLLSSADQSAGGGGRQTGSGQQTTTTTTKVPTVNIRLTGNPIACDCLLEPLISYSRRVAAATNPTLEAHIFDTQKATHPDGSLHASSRYSVLGLSTSPAQANQQATHQTGSGPPEVAGQGGLLEGQASNNALTAQDLAAAAAASRQPPVFYQFKFNDLYCAKPQNLQRQLLSHVSISDLLCPIKDQRLCPKQCKCNYQSAFKTAFVDCDNQQLSSVPEQLTDASNFVQFNIEPSFSSSSSMLQTTLSNSTQQLPIASVDKVVIYLRNNKLRSMEQLTKLFTVSSSNVNSNRLDQSPERSRFARAPARGTSGSGSASDMSSSSREEDSESPSLINNSVAQPLTSDAAATGNNNKKVVSPVMIGRSMLGGSSSGSGSQGSSSLRQVTSSRFKREDNIQENPGHSGLSNQGENNQDGFDATPNMGGNHLSFDAATTTSNNLDGAINPGISTAVLESAEEFRNKRYPMTCELHLDHNLIDSIPESFLEQLDQWRSSSIHSTLTPPQAALPTMMQEPPIHTKLHNLAISDHGAIHMSGSGPTGSSTTSSVVSESSSLVENGNENVLAMSSAADGSESSSEHLFGRPPFTPERKAALMETINQKVRLNQMQRQQQQSQPDNDETGSQPKVSVSPALVVLSLRFNNLANINAKMLQRLSKLIMSSNTKFYFGHNPFNCTDNFATSGSGSTGGGESVGNNEIGGASSTNEGGSNHRMLPASPMGDQLMAASDSSSGAYLESMADDLTPSASSSDSVHASAALVSQPLAPADCPIGQMKSWITRHRANVDDLDEIYCVKMTPELMEKLKLPSNLANSSLNTGSGHFRPADHNNLWTDILAPHSFGLNNGSNLIEKEGFTWNGELLSNGAKLVDMNVYDLCPYSGVQVLDPSASGLLSAGHQQALISVAIVFILISLCLLLMLIYFGDTQTILAFIYIHLNPLYSCLRLNESHLDGEKLYDAFVSYSSADRDIVMELIEKLEQNPNLLGGDKLSGLDFGKDTIIGSDQILTNTNGSSTQNNNNNNNNNSTSTLNRRTNSFQDLSTMSRSTSRIMMGSATDHHQDHQFGGSALDIQQTSGSGVDITGSKGAKGAPYRLCIHERDWLPGHLISWNIVNSVQNSRRTILILSKEFIKSVWFQVEFHTAYYQMLEDKIDRLIVIVRGELPPKAELDKNLAFLLTTKTYLTWGEKWFWERLHYALPHRSIPPAVGNTGTIKSAKNSGPKHYHQAPGNKPPNKQTLSGSLSSSGRNNHHQRPLVMSSIGKDCSNLLLPVHHHHQGPQAIIGSSSSSSGSSSSNTARSSGSILSGSSTGNLLSPTAAVAAATGDQQSTQTTTNDLLSALPQTATTTRLTIGQAPSENMTDSGRLTGHLSSGSLTMSPLSPRGGAGGGAAVESSSSSSSGGVTSIMVDHGPTGGPNSKIRAKKQEKLQTFVDKTISSHFNLSEL